VYYSTKADPRARPSTTQDLRGFRMNDLRSFQKSDLRGFQTSDLRGFEKLGGLTARFPIPSV
jgi:hypothetical protein